MLILGLEFELLSLVSVSILILTLITWILREWSWYSYQAKMQHTILGLQEANEDLFIKLRIEEAAQPQCLIEESGNRTLPDNFFSGNLTSGSSSDGLIYPAPLFFDVSGFIQLTIFCTLILLEYYFMHLPHLQLAQDNPTEQGIKREVQDFLLKKHPISNILVFATVALASFFAYWNFLPRVTFLDIVFKVLMALAVSSPIAFVTHNLWRVKGYFPTDKEAWQKAVSDYTWWIWLLSRLIGMYDMNSSTKTLLWLFCVGWYVWPVRYFFYYRYVSCGVSDSLSEGCVNAVGVLDTCISDVGALHATNNVFYVNMVGQGALLMLCCNIAYLLTMLKAVNVPLSKQQRSASEQKEHTTYTAGMGIDSSQYGLIGKFLRVLDHPNSVALLSLFSLLNSVLAIIRVLWFCVFSTCSWYAAMVACMFVHIHIGVSLYALPSINALMQKYSTITTYKDVFVEQFQQHQKDATAATEASEKHEHENVKDGSELHEKSSPEASAPEEEDFTAQEIFNKVLTDSVLYYLFVNSTTSSAQNAEGSNNGEGEKEKEESKLSVIFQAFLQTAAFSYQNGPNEDDATGENERNSEKDSSEPTEAANEELD